MTSNESTADPTQPSTTHTIIDSFRLGDKTCEILTLHRLDKILVNIYEMCSSGRADKVSMNEESLQFLWNNRKDIPSKHRNKCFMFPATTTEVGGMVFIHKDRDNWCRRVWLDDDCNANCVLIRLS